MNTLHTTLGALMASVLASCTAPAQKDKLKSDVTYSTHNYKQPNKEAQAGRWENASGLPVKPVSKQGLAQADYKHQNPVDSTREEGITVPYQPSATMADRHYKTKHWMSPEPKPDVAKKPVSTYPAHGD